MTAGESVGWSICLCILPSKSFQRMHRDFMFLKIVAYEVSGIIFFCFLKRRFYSRCHRFVPIKGKWLRTPNTVVWLLGWGYYFAANEHLLIAVIAEQALIHCLKYSGRFRTWMFVIRGKYAIQVLRLTFTLLQMITLAFAILFIVGLLLSASGNHHQWTQNEQHLLLRR